MIHIMHISKNNLQCEKLDSYATVIRVGHVYVMYMECVKTVQLHIVHQCFSGVSDFSPS